MIAFIDLNMLCMTSNVFCRKIRSSYPKTVCYATSGNHSFPGMDQYENIGQSEYSSGTEKTTQEEPFEKEQAC